MNTLRRVPVLPVRLHHILLELRPHRIRGRVLWDTLHYGISSQIRLLRVVNWVEFGRELLCLLQFTWLIDRIKRSLKLILNNFWLLHNYGFWWKGAQFGVSRLLCRCRLIYLWIITRQIQIYGLFCRFQRTGAPCLRMLLLVGSWSVGQEHVSGVAVSAREGLVVVHLVDTDFYFFLPPTKYLGRLFASFLG